jgi:hypothetical protein
MSPNLSTRDYRVNTQFSGALSENDLANFSGKIVEDLMCGTDRTKPYQIYSPWAGPGTGSREGKDLSQSPSNPSSSSGARPGGSSSSQRTMRERFVETTPKWMRCTDRLDYGSSLEKKSAALGCKYVQPNSANRIAWQVYDLDRADAALAYDDANVVVPNFITENPANGHAHYGYAMEVPISTGERSHEGPRNFLKAVRTGMVRRLGADPNFKFGLGKNPIHPEWCTTWLMTKPYSLHDMAAFLDPEDMRQAHKSRAEESEWAQQGRNCSLTSDLGKYGVRIGWQMRKAGCSQEQFLREMRAHAFELNNGFGDPLSFREVQAIAKSVAKWAWNESTFEKFSEIQSARAKIRSVRNWAILDTVPDLASRSSAEIAAMLGRSGRTARRYLAQVRTPTISTEKAEPWKDMGISRRTYYRRKNSGWQQ